MTGFPPISPKLQRGSIIAIDQSTRKQTTIEFQYNPDTLTRTITAQTVQENTAERGEPLRLKGPPRESISLDIEIDATDLLAQADETAVQSGIYPALAALEVLLYPSYENVDKNEKLARDGVLEIIPFEAPLTLFVWGKKRTLPVRLSGYTITEESFDPGLNPIRAKVHLELQVLTYYDLGFDNQGGEAFITHHKNIEQLAKQYHSGNKS